MLHSVKTGSVVEVTVPADNAMMLIVRLTTSGVAARSGMSMANIDDFKIAVEEAASYLLYGKSVPEKVHIQYRFEENAVRVTLEGLGCGEAPEKCGDETELEIIRAILSTLADDVNVSEDVRRIELGKRCR